MASVKALRLVMRAAFVVELERAAMAASFASQTLTVLESAMALQSWINVACVVVLGQAVWDAQTQTHAITIRLPLSMRLIVVCLLHQLTLLAVMTAMAIV